MGNTDMSTRDLASYKITDMEPLKLDQVVSGTGE